MSKDHQGVTVRSIAPVDHIPTRSITLIKNLEKADVCLDQYRSELLNGTNRELRIIVGTPDESSIHRFRVSVKRLTALYRFLAAIDPKINAKHILKPARKLSKCISKIRDIHITLYLFAELDGLDTKEVQTLQRALNARIQQDYQSFRNLADSEIQIPLRLTSRPFSMARYSPFMKNLSASAVTRISGSTRT